MRSAVFEVLEPGSLSTLQDLGRAGHMSRGVGVSGAADRSSLRLANRLVGNKEAAVCIEVTFGGLVMRAGGAATVAVTGAHAQVRRNGRLEGSHSAIRLVAGDLLSIGQPSAGLRSYVAVRGGFRAERVLGSAATDSLSGLGPLPLKAGTLIPVDPTSSDWPAVDFAPERADRFDGTVELGLCLGPRDDWFTQASVVRLLTEPWLVTSESNRVGMRLDGTALERSRDGELLSEGVALGSVQVPTHGQPILFLADHPVTGGYPVVGVVRDADVDRAAQARPGQLVRFRRC